MALTVGGTRVGGGGVVEVEDVGGGIEVDVVVVAVVSCCSGGGLEDCGDEVDGWDIVGAVGEGETATEAMLIGMGLVSGLEGGRKQNENELQQTRAQKGTKQGFETLRRNFSEYAF